MFVYRRDIDFVQRSDLPFATLIYLVYKNLNCAFIIAASRTKIESQIFCSQQRDHGMTPIFESFAT
jgi:hypothetical protein